MSEAKKPEKFKVSCTGEYLELKDGLLNILKLATSVERAKKDSDSEKIQLIERAVSEIQMSRSHKYPEAV